MAQRMAKICLFTSFLLSQFLITSLTSSQVVASILVLTDAQRDLEEVEKLHEDERQFASQFDAERFGSTECQICDRVQLLDEEYDGIPLQKFGLRHLKSDFPPVPRTWATRESALDTTNSKLASVEPVAVESSLGEAEDDVEAAEFHGQLIRRHTVWEATSKFFAARRTNLNDVVQATQINVEGFRSWADQLELAQKITGAESPLVPALDADEPVWLKPNANHQIPMFQVADVDDESEEQAVSLESIASISTPMFLVADNEVVEVKQADQNEIVEAKTSLLPDDVLSKEVFINEVNTSESSELEQPGRDQYWEYYDDCDRWGVDFAKLVFEAQFEQVKPSNDLLGDDSASKGETANATSNQNPNLR